MIVYLKLKFTGIEDNDKCIVTLWLIVQDLETDGAKAFLETASGMDDVPFAITSNDDVFTENKVDGEAVVLFKKVKAMWSHSAYKYP